MNKTVEKFLLGYTCFLNEYSLTTNVPLLIPLPRKAIFELSYKHKRNSEIYKYNSYSTLCVQVKWNVHECCYKVVRNWSQNF